MHMQGAQTMARLTPASDWALREERYQCGDQQLQAVACSSATFV
jgi:hypothetical protein